jgi:hypothetical protein
MSAKVNKVIAILAAIIFVGGCVGSFFFGRATIKDTSVVSTKVERDTIVVRDTLRESYPVEVEREVVRTEYKYLTRVDRDTITLRDTILVEIPIEEREYKGKDYRAVVGGYNPYLKSIEVYPETRYINTTETIKERKRWGFGVGVQGGYGYTPKGFQPYVGVGFSFGYNF